MKEIATAYVSGDGRNNALRVLFDLPIINPLRDVFVTCILEEQNRLNAMKMWFGLLVLTMAKYLM